MVELGYGSEVLSELLAAICGFLGIEAFALIYKLAVWVDTLQPRHIVAFI